MRTFCACNNVSIGIYVQSKLSDGAAGVIVGSMWRRAERPMPGCVLIRRICVGWAPISCAENEKIWCSDRQSGCATDENLGFPCFNLTWSYKPKPRQDSGDWPRLLKFLSGGGSTEILRPAKNAGLRMTQHWCGSVPRREKAQFVPDVFFLSARYMSATCSAIAPGLACARFASTTTVN
jgi:hypothetical protein